MDAGFGVGVALDADGFAGAFAGARVGGGALSAHGQSAHMADAAVAFDALQPFQVHPDFPAQVSFDDQLAFLDGVDDLGELLFIQVFGPEMRGDIGALQDFIGRGGADAIDVTQGDIDPFIARYFDSDDACHKNA